MILTDKKSYQNFTPIGNCRDRSHFSHFYQRSLVSLDQMQIIINFCVGWFWLPNVHFWFTNSGTHSGSHHIMSQSEFWDFDSQKVPLELGPNSQKLSIWISTFSIQKSLIMTVIRFTKNGNPSHFVKFPQNSHLTLIILWFSLHYVSVWILPFQFTKYWDRNHIVNFTQDSYCPLIIVQPPPHCVSDRNSPFQFTKSWFVTLIGFTKYCDRNHIVIFGQDSYHS